MLYKLLPFLLTNPLLLAGVLSVSSQVENIPDTAINLPEVSIQASQLLENTLGLNIWLVDSMTHSQYSNRMVAELLSQQTAVHIQSYNPGNLATVTFRGTSANHTGFFWNGISINPANNGMTDLSLLPVTFFDQIHILHGGSSSVFGEGNIGGGVHLSNEARFNEQRSLEAGIEYGSFHSLHTGLTARFSNHSWSSRIGIFLISSRNDFPFIDETKPEEPEEKMQNAGQKGMGAMGTLSRRFNNNHTVILDVWYQQMNREIPGSRVYSYENADQFDRFFRGMMTWEKSAPKTIYRFKAAYFNDFLHYTDIYEDSPEYNTDSRILTETWTGEFVNKFKPVDRFEFHSAGYFRYARVDADYYQGIKDQLQGSLFFSVKWSMPLDGWKADLNLRQGWTQGYDEPFTPSLGIEGALLRFLDLKLSVSRNFRSPTLNERFWHPGGNPELKPETSWNEEITLLLDVKKQEIPVIERISVTFFHSMISDWIQWVPMPDDPYLWSPQNVQKVRASGIESEAEFNAELGMLSTVFHASYAFTKSIDQTEEDSGYGYQLSYVPLHKGIIGVKATLKKGYIDYSQVFTGSRATTESHTETLPSFSTGRLVIGYAFVAQHYTIDFQLKIENIWDVEYQVIQYYPNPGRAFTAGLNVRFK